MSNATVEMTLVLHAWQKPNHPRASLVSGSAEERERVVGMLAATGTGRVGKHVRADLQDSYIHFTGNFLARWWLISKSSETEHEEDSGCYQIYMLCRSPRASISQSAFLGYLFMYYIWVVQY